MLIASYQERTRNYCYRTAAGRLFRRSISLGGGRPVISFTFDDFPRSALHNGGAILSGVGVSATFYTSLGLMGTCGPSGELFVADDVELLLRRNHELGCHTFHHCDSATTQSSVFERSIEQNQRALDDLVPGVRFQSFSYPINPPRIWTKPRVSKHFTSCRGGGQVFNTGVADLNYLSAFFLEKTRGDLAPVADIIERNHEAGGWLIFATHDVTENPSRFGCTPSFFERVARAAVGSGALILPVAKACALVSAPAGRT